MAPLYNAIAIAVAVLISPAAEAQQPVCVGGGRSSDQRNPSCAEEEKPDVEHSTDGSSNARSTTDGGNLRSGEFNNVAASVATTAIMIEKDDHGHSQVERQQHHQQREQEQPCGLYLAESTLHEGMLGVYSGIDRYAKSEIGSEFDLHVPIMDANLNEWSSWHDIMWNSDSIEDDLYLQNYFQIQSFTPGIPSLVQCAPKEIKNVQVQKEDPQEQRRQQQQHDGPRESSDFIGNDGINTFFGNIQQTGGRGGGGHHDDSLLPPTIGSFSYRRRRPLTATYDIKAGHELFTDCNDSVSNRGDDDNDDDEEEDEEENNVYGGDEYEYDEPDAYGETLEWLRTYGVCIDTLQISSSTIPNVGLGAFAKRKFKKGETIISSPVIQFDRSQVQIVDQHERIDSDEEIYDEDEEDDYRDDSDGKGRRRLHYTEHVKGQQLLLNYCFGHENSTVLLLPYGPGVNYINHNHQNPNAIVDWTESAAEFSDEDALFVTAHELLYRKSRRLLFDYVALRDIEEGEEIFIDYGAQWQEAWEKHVSSWEEKNKVEDKGATSSPPSSRWYTSAADYKRSHVNDPIRTLTEQEDHPYPSNIRTACLFEEQDGQIIVLNYGYKAGSGPPVYWDSGNDGCLRPCNILDREFVGGKYYYTVEVEPMINKLAPAYCDMSYDRRIVLKTPGRAIDLVDVEYTSHQHHPIGFRHEIGIPSDMFPDLWMTKDPDPTGDFLQPEMEIGQIETIRWKSDGTVVTPNAHIMKLRPSVRESLLQYCDYMGITETFRDLTYRGNSYPPGEDSHVDFRGQNWFIQRPEGHWKSNMHWISPSDWISQMDYLRALSAAGFDEVLQQIGDHFGFKGLACYHVTFIAVSHCQRGYLHYDVSNTGRKTFNVIIPLLLANETGPELDLQSLVQRNDGEWERSDREGRLRYTYDIASMMGDDAYHATSAVDYRVNKEMRMAATVYIADIGEDNVKAILDDYTQAYPPPDRPDILLRMAGAHWKHDDPTAKLPKPLMKPPDDTK